MQESSGIKSQRIVFDFGNEQGVVLDVFPRR